MTARIFLVALLAGLISSIAAPRCLAQAQENKPFLEEQRITAVDVIVELDEAAFRRWQRGNRSRPILAQRFFVRADRLTRTVVALEKPESRTEVTQTVVFDVANSTNRVLRWGASLLSEHTEALTELGPVEILVGTPEIQQVLAATRDVPAIRERLSQLALTLTGDDRLAAMRLAASDEESLNLDFARCQEQAATIRAHDELLRALVDPSRSADRRALYWVTGGFATDLAAAYGVSSKEGGSLDRVTEQEAGKLDLKARNVKEEALALGETLAAYGWTTLVLSPPPPDPLRGKGRGWRVGKFRFLGPAATYEKERDVDKAEAFLDVGDAHRKAGNAEQAAEAYDSAYYHFWGDPRTASRQAVALAGLADQLRILGRDQEARKARSMARELDPAAVPATVVRPWSMDDSTLATLALMTAGQRVMTAADLLFALDSLNRRVRLTFQIDGAPTGRLMPLEVRFDDDKVTLRAPWRARSGPPGRLAAARARLALVEQTDEIADGGGSLGLEAEQVDPRTLKVAASYRGPATHGRLTVAAGNDDGCSRIGHVDWLNELPPPAEMSLTEPAAVILWHDFETGDWGGVRRRTGLPGQS